MIDDLHGPQVPELPDHEAGRTGRVGRQVSDIDPLAPELATDHGPEGIRADAPHVGHRVAQPRQADRDVGLRARHGAQERGRACERPALPRDERDEALAERDDLRRARVRHASPARGARRSQPSPNRGSQCCGS